MHKLRYFYYQNKEKIWKVAILIAFLLGIIYFMNYLAGKNANSNTNQGSQGKTSIYSNEPNKTYISDKSAISGSTVSKQEAEKVNSSISVFLQYCKSGNIEEAYNMLSNDCRESEYETLEKFKQKYVNTKFNLNDVYKIERWLGNTYRITISEDLLATGDLDKGKQLEYITIVKEDSKDKLNINGYIGKKGINVEKTENNIKITVLNKKVYMDYEMYEFKVENLSNNTIKLDSLEKTGTMYLEASEKVKFKAYAHELYDSDLEIKSKHSFNISIKYAKTYSTESNIRKIVFNNLILDYPKYKNEENKQNFKDIYQFKINL